MGACEPVSGASNDRGHGLRADDQGDDSRLEIYNTERPHESLGQVPPPPAEARRASGVYVRCTRTALAFRGPGFQSCRCRASRVCDAIVQPRVEPVCIQASQSSVVPLLGKDIRLEPIT